MNFSFLKRNVENRKCYFELFWENEFGDLGLKLFDSQHLYKGKVTIQDIQLLSTKAKKSFEEFWTETASIFNECNAEKLVFELKFEETSAVFTWKKILGCDNIKQKLGSVKLLKSLPDDGEIPALLDDIFSLVNRQSKCIDNLTKDKDTAIMEYNQILKKMDELTERKEKLETELFSKFALVLNAKKEKIKKLKDEMRMTTTTTRRDSTTIETVKKEAKRKRPLQQRHQMAKKINKSKRKINKRNDSETEEEEEEDGGAHDKDDGSLSDVETDTESEHESFRSQADARSSSPPPSSSSSSSLRPPPPPQLSSPALNDSNMLVFDDSPEIGGILSSSTTVATRRKKQIPDDDDDGGGDGGDGGAGSGEVGGRGGGRVGGGGRDVGVKDVGVKGGGGRDVGVKDVGVKDGGGEDGDSRNDENHDDDDDDDGGKKRKPIAEKRSRKKDGVNDDDDDDDDDGGGGERISPPVKKTSKFELSDTLDISKLIDDLI